VKVEDVSPELAKESGSFVDSVNSRRPLC